MLTRVLPALAAGLAAAAAFGIAPACGGGGEANESPAGFGTGGRVRTDLGGVEEAKALAIQDDGRIVVAGGSAVVRYLPSGRLDASFGTRGQVSVPEGRAEALAIQDDGKLVVASFTAGGFVLVRYTPQGRLDASFGAGGKAVTDFTLDDEGYESADAVALQQDGRIVAGGGDGLGTFALARYMPDGRLDPSFGRGGKVVDELGGGTEIHAIAIRDDGKIVAAGSGTTTDGWNVATIAQYTSEGVPDHEFGRRGVVRGLFYARAVALDRDGRIVTAEGYDDFALARYSEDGQADTTFADSGRAFAFRGDLDYEGTAAEANAIAIDEEGRIVAVGTLDLSDVKGAALVRYTDDGQLDEDFGKGGKVVTTSAHLERASAVALQDDGKIVVAGGTGGDFAVVRYNADGTLDR